jgi:hypothetical protein
VNFETCEYGSWDADEKYLDTCAGMEIDPDAFRSATMDDERMGLYHNQWLDRWYMIVEHKWDITSKSYYWFCERCRDELLMLTLLRKLRDEDNIDSGQ